MTVISNLIFKYHIKDVGTPTRETPTAIQSVNTELGFHPSGLKIQMSFLLDVREILYFSILKRTIALQSMLSLNAGEINSVGLSSSLVDIYPANEEMIYYYIACDI